jgi:hypothetical protein
MDSREYTGWLVYERLYGPLGPERHDYLTAMQMAQVHNSNRKKGSTAAKVADFAPPWADTSVWPWAETKAEQTPEDHLRAAQAAMRQMGAGGGRR